MLNTNHHKQSPEACNFIEKETLTQAFSCESCEISKNTFFTEHLWTTASEPPLKKIEFKKQFWTILNNFLKISILYIYKRFTVRACANINLVTHIPLYVKKLLAFKIMRKVTSRARICTDVIMTLHCQLNRWTMHCASFKKISSLSL